MIAHVLKGKYKVFETIGNQNSQVGVPLTLDHLTSEDEIGVLEMGMSEKARSQLLATLFIQTLVLSQMLAFLILK